MVTIYAGLPRFNTSFEVISKEASADAGRISQKQDYFDKLPRLRAIDSHYFATTWSSTSAAYRAFCDCVLPYTDFAPIGLRQYSRYIKRLEVGHRLIGFSLDDYESWLRTNTLDQLNSKESATNEFLEVEDNVEDQAETSHGLHVGASGRTPSAVDGGYVHSGKLPRVWPATDNRARIGAENCGPGIDSVISFRNGRGPVSNTSLDTRRASALRCSVGRNVGGVMPKKKSRDPIAALDRHDNYNVTPKMYTDDDVEARKAVDAAINDRPQRRELEVWACRECQHEHRRFCREGGCRCEAPTELLTGAEAREFLLEALA